MAAKVPAGPEFGYGEPSAFGRALYGGISWVAVIANRSRGVAVLGPRFAGDGVLPRRDGSRLDVWVVREFASVEIQIIVIVPEVPVGYCWGAGWLRKR